MAESAKSMMRQGLISARQFNRIGNLGTWAHGPKGTKPQNSKMAGFDAASKDEGGSHQSGATGVASSRSINQHQEFGPRVSKGGAVNKGGQPNVDHIEHDQNPKFPAGGSKVKKRKWSTSGRAGAVRPSGPPYGGPSGRP